MEKFDPTEYQVDSKRTVDQLTFEELQQEVCRLIDHLEEYSELTEKLADLEKIWRST